MTPNRLLMKTPTIPVIYIVDNDPALRDSLQCLLESVGLQARAFTDIDTFLTVYQADQPACLLLDIRASGRGDPSSQQQLRERGIDVPVIIITGHGNVATAVTAMMTATTSKMTLRAPVATVKLPFRFATALLAQRL